mgnify:FL=1
MKKRFIGAFACLALSVLPLFGNSVTAAAEEKVVPGYNILTGNTSAWTCDSMTFPEGIAIEAGCDLTKSPVSGDDNNSVLVSRPRGKYMWVSFSNSLLKYPKERAYKFSFKSYKRADGVYTNDPACWIMKNGGAGWQVVAYVGSFTPNEASWKEHSYILKNFGKLHDNNGVLDTSDIEKFIIQWARATDDTENLHEEAYFDDLSIIPSYKITYCDTDGSLIREEYDYFDEESFKPVLTDEDKALYRIGWSVENDKTADETVPLLHEDITLYAVYDEDAHVYMNEDISLLTAAGKSALVTGEYVKYGDTSKPKLSFSIVSGADTVSLSDNGDGTATVTSMKEGSAKIRCGIAGTDTFAEIYILSDYTSGDSAVRIFAGSDSITEDAGTLDLDGRVFYADAPSASVEWNCSSSESAWLEKNSDGSAKLTAINNGSVVITAYDKQNTETKAEITVKITGQFAKTSSYSFRYYAVGNSFLVHPPLKGWSDVGGMGMAASDVSKDYFNQIQSKLSKKFYSSITAERKSMSAFEGLCSTEATKDTYEDSAPFIEFRNKIREFKPNILTIQLAENIKTTDEAALSLFYDTLYGMVAKEMPKNSVVVCISIWLPDDNRHHVAKKYAEKYGFEFADTSYIGSLGINESNNYLAFRQYPDYVPGIEFRSHPGDFGMEYIAQQAVNCLERAIPASIPLEYRYIPESIQITGADTISEESASVSYDVIMNPAKAEKAVIWSVDNENIASISDEGVLTALNNGTVTITAKYAYDTSISSSKTVTITGQTEHFRLTYVAGTEDSVTNLPETDEYAKGKYILSSQAPARAGYKFVGWALSENGDTVTEIVITADTTVYAVWEFAYFWDFNTDGYDEGVSMNAFNVSVKDGTLNGISYQTGLSFSADNLLINASDFETFSFAAKVLSSESNQSYTVTLNTTNGDKVFTAEIPDSSMRSYSFDISGLAGTITGFTVKVSMSECTASVDKIAFIKKTSVAVENETSVRIKEPSGLRFKASIDNTERAEVSQYGFIVARASDLSKAELNHVNMNNGTIKAVEGIAYDKDQNIDIVFATADDKTFFAAALINIPEKSYLEKLSVRAFVKSGSVYSYSDVYTDTLAHAAQRIKNENGELYKNNMEFIEKILETVRKYETEFDISDLYN